MSAHRDWHHADVKAALEKKGLDLSAIARANGIDVSSVSLAIRTIRRRQMSRVKALVAAAIGVPPSAIWPSIFDGQNRPRWKRRPHKRTTPNGRRNVCGSVHRDGP
ncbi:MAG: helix-turn-helix domain-containing protein [Rhodospirillales bacterium]|nr:helix-turn-helix domain-containing protein [Rhodospirillales bacterium]